MSDDRIERLIGDLRHEADTHQFMDLAEPAIAAGTRTPLWSRSLDRLRTRAGTAAASLLLVFGGLGGVAYAANGASPGGTLYQLDRAFESLGIGNGGAAERLVEIQTLIDSGEIGQGLEHAAENLVADLDAQAALQEAATRVAETPAPEGVSELLVYLGDNVGAVDGPTVAELARSIGHGPPETTPVGPPEETPGPPAEVPPVDLTIPDITIPEAPLPSGVPPTTVGS